MGVWFGCFTEVIAGRFKSGEVVLRDCFGGDIVCGRVSWGLVSVSDGGFSWSGSFVSRRSVVERDFVLGVGVEEVNALWFAILVVEFVSGGLGFGVGFLF